MHFERRKNYRIDPLDGAARSTCYIFFSLANRDIQRLEHGGGKPATGGMDSHLSTLQHQLQSLEIRQQQVR